MKPTIVCLVVVMLAGSALAQNAERPSGDSLAVTPVPSQAQTVDSAVIREKIERAGYSEIAELARDSTGVWRARAKKGGEVFDVVVDKGGRIKPEPR